MSRLNLRSISCASALGLALSLAACATTEPSRARVVAADAAARDPLLDAVKSLAGRWRMHADDGSEMFVEFSVTSAGSAVREVMFPGEEHEMTNMYTLDGNGLLVTHYCAMGNQPSMRATHLDGSSLTFDSDGVRDLQSEDEVYMGALKLVRVDADHVEEHWTAFKAGRVDHSSVFRFERVRG